MPRRRPSPLSVRALLPKGVGAELLAHQAAAGNFGGPNEDCGLLATLYSLVVLMDFGLDPASKQARRMIGRVREKLVFRPLGNRPFLDGETEPCINGRILALGAYFDQPNDALARQLLDEQLDDGGWNCEAPQSPVLFVSHNHLRAGGTARL